MKNLNEGKPQRIDYDEQLQSLARWNKEHKKLLENSTNAGCYYCCEIYPASEIKEWVRSYRRKGEKPDCALCPKCGIDSVLPDVKVTLTLDILKAMHLYWFDSGDVSLKLKDGQIVDIIDVDNKYEPKAFEEWRAKQLASLEDYQSKKNSKIILDLFEKTLDK